MAILVKPSHAVSAGVDHVKQLSFIARCMLPCLLPAVCSAAPVGPLEVRVAAAGRPGHWILHFRVAKDASQFAPDARIHVFGVQLPEEDEIVQPPGYDIRYSQTWDLQGAGGSAASYNKAWIASAGEPRPSNGVHHFRALSRADAAPDTVPWFVWAKSDSQGTYTGDAPFFGSRAEPHFEGLALAASVPEPATYGLFGLGLACVAAARQLNARGAGLAHAD
jgi:hypothetical protein